MKKYLFIFNPVSGKGKGERMLPFIRYYLDSNKISYTISVTQYPKHAIEIIKKDALDYDTVVAVGGDGTLNEVITGLIQCKLDKYIGIIPVGSGNDFVKNADFGKNYKESLAVITASTPNILHSDIGYANIVEDSKRILNIYFINSLGIGFDAQVAFYKEKIKIIKGILSYLTAVIKTLLVYKPIDITVKLNDKLYNGKKLLCCIGNGVSSGGGFYLTPSAKINDGLLNLTLVDNLKIKQILRYLPLALLNKISNAKVAKFDIFKTINIFISNGAYVHSDGEIITENAKEITVGLLEKKLKILCK